MKNKILSIIAAAYCLVACDLTHTPLAALSPETFFSNESELQAFSNTFYTSLTVGGFDEISDMLTKNVLTDEIMGSRTVPNSGGGWSYTALRNFNTLIEYSVNCPDEKIRTQYVALARFFRANFYFDKVKRFGDVPWYDKQLGSDDPGLYKPRDSREFVMSKVIEDLDFAIANLPDKKDLYRITKWTALALKSRACLFEGTFRKYHAGQSTLETLPADAKPYTYYLELSAAASEEIMNTSGYSIFRGNGKATAYRDLFLGDPETGNAFAEEIILARDYNEALNILHNSTFFTIGNYGNQSMTRKMACTYLMDDGTRYTAKEGWQTKEFADEMKNRDPRMAQTLRTPGYIVDGKQTPANLASMKLGYQLRKYYIAVEYDGFSEVDMPIFRLGEVLLNLAEAKAELGTLTQADLDKTVNLLRDRVGMVHMELSNLPAGSDIRTEIQRERRIELFFEGHRYFDIIRWKQGHLLGEDLLGVNKRWLDQSRLAVDLDKDLTWKTKDGQQYLLIETGRTFNPDKHYLLPIPFKQMQLNPNLAPQNPGWN